MPTRPGVLLPRRDLTLGWVFLVLIAALAWLLTAAQSRDMGMEPAPVGGHDGGDDAAVIGASRNHLGTGDRPHHRGPRPGPAHRRVRRRSPARLDRIRAARVRGPGRDRASSTTTRTRAAGSVRAHSCSRDCSSSARVNLAVRISLASSASNLPQSARNSAQSADLAAVNNAWKRAASSALRPAAVSVTACPSAASAAQSPGRCRRRRPARPVPPTHPARARARQSCAVRARRPPGAATAPRPA